MADFDSIKISHLLPTAVVSKDDLLVIDRLQSDKTYFTQSITIGRIVDFITVSDLNFTGNVTFIGTIQAPPTFTLNAIFDDVVVRNSFTLAEGADVIGLYLVNLEDVILDSPQVGETLVYKTDPNTGDAIFTNEPLPNFITDAPQDGGIYARQDGDWKDITDCIKCPTDESNTIGSVLVTKISPGDIYVDEPVTFGAFASGNANDETYSWNVSPNTVVVAASSSYTVLFEFDDLLRSIVGLIKHHITSIDDTIRVDTTSQGLLQLIVNDSEVTFTDDFTSNDFSYSVSDNNASITIRQNGNKVVSLDRIVELILNSISSHEYVFESPYEGTYKIEISDENRLQITQKSNMGVEVVIPINNTSTEELSWRLYPNTVSMSNPRSSSQVITFKQPVNYVVSCEVSSPTATDSPRTGAIEVFLNDTYRLLTDYRLDVITNERGEALSYD